ncbi:MAG: Mur ligase family protein, partial [Flavobacteriales bacterium]
MTTPFRTSTDTVDRLLNEVHQAQGVSTDTRDALRGLVFWALTGERFDGNDFVEAALKQGAAHVVSNRTEWKDDPQVTVVEDVLDALQATARALRRTWDCPVLALTGSNGKTTTKELLRDVLAEGMGVHATSGNFNNHIGVPLTLLRAPAQPEFVVVEMGANHQREIALLCA